jgi:formylglycine-generating enzyme required for sulfatase activity
VSAFQLDVYEVTVGRFRAFVDAGRGTQLAPPGEGEGAHPALPGSGWSSEWVGELAPGSDALRAALSCSAYATWTDEPCANEARPINCVTWYEALAFCAWDGGRLPTEAEWAYAAAGGDEQRLYPWGGAAPAARAVYACTGDGSAAGDCAPGDLLPVGSRSPAGDGRWGGADLAGNVMEWTLDVYHVAPPVPCLDCADLTRGVTRVPRGGSFATDELGLATTTRGGLPPDLHTHEIGFRCVR